MMDHAARCEFGNTKEKILFTPGPLTTSRNVKQVMLEDFGSRDDYFTSKVRSIRERLLRLGFCGAESYASVLIPGSGTYGVESVLSSSVGKHDRLLILENGAYGKRMEMIAKAHNLSFKTITFPENQKIDPKTIRDHLSNNHYTHIAMIHCETTTGILNPIMEIGALAKEYNANFIVDAMSSFGGIPIDIPRCSIDFLISSSNKCLEGVPGFSFVIASKTGLLNSEGKARTLSLDLFSQYRTFENDGQFRFTPPTHVIIAFSEALGQLEQEGGINARFKRYQANHAHLLSKMTEMGFTCYIDEEKQSPIITSFKVPNNPRFDFKVFYKKIRERGFLIYPGKVSDADCFRIGTIGHIFPHDIDNLMGAVECAIKEMSIKLPLP